MGFLGKKPTAYNGDGYYDPTDGVTVTGTDEPFVPPRAKEPPKGIDLKVITPLRFEEASAIADQLLSGSMIFLNVEATPAELIPRLIDFLSGVTYAIGGNISHVTPTAYIIAPDGVDVSDAGMGIPRA